MSRYERLGRIGMGLGEFENWPKSTQVQCLQKIIDLSFPQGGKAFEGFLPGTDGLPGKRPAPAQVVPIKIEE